MNRTQIADSVESLLREVPIVDVHTHVFDPAMEELLLTGIDELLNYHYHVAEFFRARPEMAPADFYALSPQRRADLVWQALFLDQSPLSEVGRGLVTFLRDFGLDPVSSTLEPIRAWFAERLRDPRAHVDDVLRRANVVRVAMTNDPLDDVERSYWERGFARDSRFPATLRLDSAIMNWPRAVPALRDLGYAVDTELGPRTYAELRRYLSTWYERFDAGYMAVSLPPTFADSTGGTPSWRRILEDVVIPTAGELRAPLALMIGVRREVNPAMKLAGDSVGVADVTAVERLAADHPSQRFLITLLSRESQHSLCVAARKFANVEPFGCWWFVNVPSVAKDITAMRLDLLGPSFVPQHSDARVIEQVYFKWQRSRRWLAEVLTGHYADLADAGGRVDRTSIERDLRRMLGTGFAQRKSDLSSA